MGAFTLYNDSEAASTAVSNLFIDEYMKDANDAQIKIYLYLVRMMGARRATSISDMADQFNHTEKEVLRSLKYWEKQGLLTIDYDNARQVCGIHLCELRTVKTQRRCDNRVISITPLLESAMPAENSEVARQASALPEQSEKAAGKTASAASSRKRITAADLESFRSNEERSQLLFVVEKYIGKPLSVSEMKTIYYISEELHFSDNLIDYLVQYCVDNGKKDFRYIEKVAVNWAAEGITTSRQAQSALAAGRKNGRARAVRPTGGKFGQFEQNQYDFDQLEKELLSN